MSKPEDPIRACLQECQSLSDGTWQSCFVFPEDFPGFQGHFPSNPVLPGFYMIQAVLVAAECACGRRMRLREVMTAKFLAAVRPKAVVRVLGSVEPAGDGAWTVKARWVVGEQRMAEMTLRVDDVSGVKQ